MGFTHTLLSISSRRNLQLDVLTNTTSTRPTLSSFLRLFPPSGSLPKNALKLAQLRFKDSYNKNHIYVPYEPGDKVLINIPFNYRNQRALSLCSLEGTTTHSRLPNVLVRSLIEFGFLIPMALIPCSASRIPNDSGPTLIKNGRTYNLFERIQKNTKSKKSWSSERNAIAKDTGLCTNADGKIKGLPSNGYRKSHLRNAKEALDAWKLKQKELNLASNTIQFSTDNNCRKSYETTNSSNIVSNPMVFPYDPLHLFQALSENTHLEAPSSTPPPIHYLSPFHPSPILPDAQFPNLFKTVIAYFLSPLHPPPGIGKPTIGKIGTYGFHTRYHPGHQEHPHCAL